MDRFSESFRKARPWSTLACLLVGIYVSALILVFFIPRQMSISAYEPPLLRGVIAAKATYRVETLREYRPDNIYCWATSDIEGGKDFVCVMGGTVGKLWLEADSTALKKIVLGSPVIVSADTTELLENLGHRGTWGMTPVSPLN